MHSFTIDTMIYYHIYNISPKKLNNNFYTPSTTANITIQSGITTNHNKDLVNNPNMTIQSGITTNHYKLSQQS